MGIDDERVAFYLRNRDRIEEWAALRTEAAAAIDEWLTSLQPYVVQLAAELGSDVCARAAIQDESAWPRFRLVRSTWVDAAAADPPVSICLEWGRGRTTLHGLGAPYVGVRSPKTHALGVTLREAENMQKARVSRKDLTNAWWVAYNYVRPDAEFPTAAEAYQERLLDNLRDAWTNYAPLIDSVMRSAEP